MRHDIANAIEGRQAIVDILDTPAALLDGHGKVVCCNPLFVDALGVDPTGSKLPELVGPPTCNVLEGALHRADGQPVSSAFDGITLRLTFKPAGATETARLILCQTARNDDDGRMPLQELIDQLEQGVWDYRVKSRRFTVSPAWCRMRGLPIDIDVNATAHDGLNEIHPEDRGRLKELFNGQARGVSDSIDLQYRYRHKSGEWIWILCRAKVIGRDRDGKPDRIVGIDADITTLKRQDEEIFDLNTKLQLAIKAAGVGVWEYDPARQAVIWDDRMLEIYGITDGVNIRSGDLWETYLHPDDLAATVAYSDLCQAEGRDFQRDYRIVRPDGSVRHIRSLAGVVAAKDMAGRLVGVNIDITDDYERKAQLEAAHAQLEYDTRHDALTGLANRRLLDERMAELRKRSADTDTYAVLHLDLDRFKVINDSYGHAAGDAVLKHVGQTIRDIVKDQGLACRTGGDEFVVLFEVAPPMPKLEAIANALLSAFARPFDFKGHSCDIGVSIGSALGYGHAKNMAEIFIQADNALYAAKQAGRGRHRHYSPQVKAAITRDAPPPAHA